MIADRAAALIGDRHVAAKRRERTGLSATAAAD